MYKFKLVQYSVYIYINLITLILTNIASQIQFIRASAVGTSAKPGVGQALSPFALTEHISSKYFIGERAKRARHS